MGQPGGYSNYRFVIAGLTIWGHFAVGASFQAISPILPLITEDYGISHTTAGLLVGSVLVVVGLFGIPAGIIVGRVGVWRAYTAGWFLVGLMALAALAPGFEGLLALRIASSLGMVVVFPATAPLVMQWFRPRELVAITSLNTASVSIGMALSAFTAAPLADVMGWERVLGLYGAMGLAGAFAWLFLGRVPQSAAPRPAPLPWSDVKAVLTNKMVLLLGAADASCFSMYMALSSWLPTFYDETRGISLTQAGFIIGLLPIMGIFAVLLGGFLPMKIGRKRLFFIVPGTVAALGGLGSFTIDNTVLIYVSVALLGLGAWMYVPTLITLPMELPGMTPQRIALVWGWFMTAPGIGGFIAPLVVGVMRDSLDSFTPGFLVFALLAWFLVFAGFLLPGMGGQGTPSPGPAVSADRAPD